MNRIRNNTLVPSRFFLLFAGNSRCPFSAFNRTSCLFETNKKFKHLNRLTPENAVNPLSKPLEFDKNCLHVVSVPIGNVKDFTVRALEILKACDYIVCENRNSTKALLDIIDISSEGRLIQYNAGKGNEGGSNKERLIELIKGGRSVAFVSPSGTPCVGSCGSELVREMIHSGIRVSPVPGASSITAALSASGANLNNDVTNLLNSPFAFASSSFFFGGYLSTSPGLRAKQLRQICNFSCPVVFFDVPRRLIDTLTDIDIIIDSHGGVTGASQAVALNGPTAPHLTTTSLPDKQRFPRRVAVLHELTKFHEATHVGTAKSLLNYYTQMKATRTTDAGQIVIVIDGLPEQDIIRMQTVNKDNAEKIKIVNNSNSSNYVFGPIFGKTEFHENPQPSSFKDRCTANNLTPSQSILTDEKSKLIRKKKLQRRKRMRLINRIIIQQERLNAKKMILKESIKKTTRPCAQPLPL